MNIPRPSENAIRIAVVVTFVVIILTLFGCASTPEAARKMSTNQLCLWEGSEHARVELARRGLGSGYCGQHNAMVARQMRSVGGALMIQGLGDNRNVTEVRTY